MQIKDVINKTTQFFREKGFESPRLDTELLIASAMKWERMKIYLNYEYPLSEDELTQCREHVRRRASGEPVAYILGRKDFYNHSFRVNSSVLIPRPETETIVELVMAWAKPPPRVSEEEWAKVGTVPEDGLQLAPLLEESMRGEPLRAESVSAEPQPFRIVDLGTGSGCIGLSLLAELPNALLLAVDLSSDAVATAKDNASDLAVENRATFVLKDAATIVRQDVERGLRGLADVVVSNPPYIGTDDQDVEVNVRKWEPAQALFTEKNGLACIESWAPVAAEVSRPGALIIFEIGHSQAAQAKSIFERVGQFTNVEVIRDLSGHERFIRCIRAEGNS